MKLSQLAAKPVLIKITLDSEDIIAEHGESVEFWTWDRQPLDVFMKLANLNTGENTQVVEIVKDLILDEEGNRIVVDGMTLPTNTLIAAIGEITKLLGK